VLLGICVLAVAGCGGEENVSPLPESVEGQTGGGETTAETGGATETSGETGGETATGGGGGEGGEGDAAAGEAIFMEQGCGGCHTLEAAGSSGTIGPNLDEAQPDSALVVERVTNGAGAMPSFKDKLSEEDINNVAAYVVESTQ
jgi:sulfite dehydrogenase